MVPHPRRGAEHCVLVGFNGAAPPEGCGTWWTRVRQIQLWAFQWCRTPGGVRNPPPLRCRPVPRGFQWCRTPGGVRNDYSLVYSLVDQLFQWCRTPGGVRNGRNWKKRSRRSIQFQWCRTPGGVRNGLSLPHGGWGGGVSMVPHPRRGAELSGRVVIGNLPMFQWCRTPGGVRNTVHPLILDP